MGHAGGRRYRGSSPEAACFAQPLTAGPGNYLRAEPVHGTQRWEEGHTAGRAATPREAKEEPGPSGVEDSKGQDSFEKELGQNHVECSLDITKHVD